MGDASAVSLAATQANVVGFQFIVEEELGAGGVYGEERRFNAPLATQHDC